jgi:hypothetical protein
MPKAQPHQNKPNKSAVPMLIFLDKQPRLLYTFGMMKEANNDRGPKMQETDEQIGLQETAAKIAVALGEDWKYDGKKFNECGALISGANGLSLFLSDTWGPKGSLHISGRFPEGRGSDKHKINVSLTRSPETIAREIRRRLLPDYAIAFGIADQKKRENDAYEAALRETAKHFFDFLGKDGGDDPDRLTFFFEGGEGRVDGPGEVELRLHNLPEQIARQIIAVVRSLATPLAEVNSKFAGLPNPIELANAEKLRQQG